jgi:starvation-inducible DNA-binding protein
MSEMTTDDKLNTLLADYMIYYQKLRNYHWNVKGSEFFKLHEKFEEAYNEAADFADDIAERILARGSRPASTMNEFINTATLSEDKSVPTAEEMVANLVNDIETLNGRTVELIPEIEETGDRATANLLDDIIDAQDERLWMFRTFLAE